MHLDPMDMPPATARSRDMAIPVDQTGATERLLISAGILVALAFLSLPLLGSPLALSITLLVSPVVLGVMMRKHVTPQLLAAGAAVSLPVALGVLWLT